MQRNVTASNCCYLACSLRNPAAIILVRLILQICLRIRFVELALPSFRLFWNYFGQPTLIQILTDLIDQLQLLYEEGLVPIIYIINTVKSITDFCRSNCGKKFFFDNRSPKKKKFSFCSCISYLIIYD